MRRSISMLVLVVLLATFELAMMNNTSISAQNTNSDQETVRQRKDVRHLPDPLKARLVELAGRPHTFVPMQAFSEADNPSQLFQYYLLDTTHFEPNVFTATIPGINDGVAPTATGPNHDLPTIGAVRVVLEPKPGLPTDPNDPGAFIDVFTDVSGLFVINNESGWYEGWMIHDIVVPPVGGRRSDGSGAQFGTITAEDAAAVAAMGSGNNTPGHIFTRDGNVVHLPSATDHFPDVQTNVVPIQLSMGACNALQQSDIHSYWEFNQYSDWVFPQYELPFTGGFDNEFAGGRVGFLSSIVPGSGPSGTGPSGPGSTGGNDPRIVGDNPNNPRDPDRALDTNPADPDRGMVQNDDHKEKRTRFIPSGLAEEILIDVYMRLASFEPGVTDKKQRLFDAYAKEVARVDQNGDGILSFVEVDLEDNSDGGQSNDRLYIPATRFNRFAITREINDGLLAPRFAPSQRAWVLSGNLVVVSPAISASTNQDGDNR
ncbi:MAG TPA: hypothetical protein VNO24_19215 [Blastocatellia bacterium]|nr:hypothetical protein [Blastocatellia bacterium]